jgi:hypothetical protein
MTLSCAVRALGGAIVLPLAMTCANAATPTPLPLAIPGECVNGLRNVHAGTGARTFASQYVYAGQYAYGEWLAGGARGQSLWHKRGTTWCKVSTGADVLDEHALEGYGVAPGDARRLLAAIASGPQIAPPHASPQPAGAHHR